MRKPIVELIVGLFMLVGILALVVLAFRISGLTNYGSGDTYAVTADFDNIGDLKPRAPVTLAGVTVGQVGTIKLDSKTFRAHVTLLIYARNKDIPTDSSASIFTQGLLGSNYISLTPGFADSNLKNGDHIEVTRSALILENLIGQFLYSFKGGEKDANSKNQPAH